MVYFFKIVSRARNINISMNEIVQNGGGLEETFKRKDVK